eukprot:2027164-Ditylum_brightwellii.AAC.1
MSDPLSQSKIQIYKQQLNHKAHHQKMTNHKAHHQKMMEQLPLNFQHLSHPTTSLPMDGKKIMLIQSTKMKLRSYKIMNKKSL